MSQSTCLSGSILKTVSTLLLLGLSANIHATTAADFDIERYSTAGAGWFETFHVQETQALQQALTEGKLSTDMLVLVMETAAGRLALIKDQMAYHHIAQGTAGGRSWMVTF